MTGISWRNITEFQENLLEWYSYNGRHFFPWREVGLTNYELIVAEVLLQRTKAETVSRFYKSFLIRFPSWQAIAEASRHDIEECLQPVGLYRQRAARLQQLAMEMVRRQGELPTSRQELESIPFVGQYIANAIELLVHHKPSYLLDVNMARVLERYFGERKLADIRYDPYLQKLAAQVTNHAKAKELNWAILDFAASICKARGPLCDRCLVSAKCKYFKTLLQTSRQPL
jgi:A/G-specific adenine glycosylase